MRNLTKILVVVVSAIVIVWTAGVLTPRVVKAVSATLVQNIDSPARNAWNEHCSFEEGMPNEGCGLLAPVGKELVIQTVTFQGTAPAYVNDLVLTLNIPSDENSSWSTEIHKTALNVIPAVPWINIDAPIPTSNASYFLSGTSTTLYVNPSPGGGSPINVSVNTIKPHNPNEDTVEGVVAVFGYTVNLGTN
jgi:hypothetical protein